MPATQPPVIISYSLVPSESTLRFPRLGNRTFTPVICRIQLLAFFQIRRRRKELLTTETELKAIAAAANSGFNKIPKKGYKAPAAIGMPITL